MNARFFKHVPIIPAGVGCKANPGAGEGVTRLRGLRGLLCAPRPEKGQTIVEFAFVVVMFFILVFGVFDFGHLFFVKMEVQNAVQEAARFASTGNHLPDPKHSGQDLSRVDSIISTLHQTAGGADITDVQISSLNGGAGSAGGPGDTMTITVTASTPLLTPFIAELFPKGRYSFTTSVTIKNEPFPASQTK